MWIVYHKEDRKIVGMSAHSEVELEKETALREVVDGLVISGKQNEYDAIQVKDREEALNYMEAYPDRLVLKGTEDEPQLAIEEPEIFWLLLKSDAPDAHPVDGIPEIPADGSSFTTITIQKLDKFMKPIQRKDDNDQLYLRTDHGILRNTEGTDDINSVKLNKGEASIRLYSEDRKRVATVEVISADHSLNDALIRIEFI